MKIRFVCLTFFFFLSLFLSGCMSEGAREVMDQMANAYSEVCLEDGIDNEEATTLAGVYFTWHISGCGAIRQVIDDGSQWKFETVVGFAAKPYKPIFVDKKTGMITCSKGPTVKPPKQFNER